ncbi:hypothetical protein [Nonomuraea endophytica]|uniref:hypothetical protein n=1 Tax=Nonomuraea endophytica TaxID=714136 RepID=UPI0037C4FBDD
MITEETPVKAPSPPGRIWAIGVLVLSALVSMSMNTWHAWTVTSLPKPLAVLYGVAPVALAAMQSHAVALRALRQEKVGPFRRVLTFALVLGGLGLSFLGIYDMLRHAVPDPIPAVPIHEPAVFFSIVLDVMALAALHELLRESPAFATAALATAPAVPELVSTNVEMISFPHGGSLDVESSTVVEEDRQPAIQGAEAGVPAQVSEHDAGSSQQLDEVVPASMFSHQAQPGTEGVYDDPLRGEVLKQYLPDLLEGGLPSVRTIKDQMSVGTDRARRLQSYLGQLVEATQ